MRSFIGVLVLMIRCVIQSANAQQIVKVPEGRGNPVLIDGIFSRDEWQDAAIIKVNDSVTLDSGCVSPSYVSSSAFISSLKTFGPS